MLHCISGPANEILYHGAICTDLVLLPDLLLIETKKEGNKQLYIVCI